MANTSSAKKEARAGLRRTLRSRSVRSSVKTRISKARRALLDGGEGAVESTVAAISSLDRAAEKGILHPNNAARRKSRLARLMNARSAPTPAPAKGEKGKAKRTRTASKTAPAKKAPARKAAAKK
jgi:small subunit ribosomal protein S20